MFWIVQQVWFDAPVAWCILYGVAKVHDDRGLGRKARYRRCLQCIEQLEIEMGIHFDTEMKKLEEVANPVIEVVADSYTSPSRKADKIQWARYDNAYRRGKHGVALEPYDYNSAASIGITAMDLYTAWEDGLRDRPFVVPPTPRYPKKVIHVDPASITARSSDIANNLGIRLAKTTEHWENESCFICDMQKIDRTILDPHGYPPSPLKAQRY